MLKQMNSPKIFSKFPVWGLLIISGCLFLVSAVALRANNQNMIKLREAVFVADEKNGDIEGALKNLREYVYAHMNTDLAAGNNAVRPPIQLKYTYDRLVQAELANRGGEEGDLYTKAQDYCERTRPNGLSGRNRLDCVQQYVDQHGLGQMPEVSIPEDLYKFDFVSPRWSADLAGLSLVFAFIFLGLFLIKFGVGLVIDKKLQF